METQTAVRVVHRAACLEVHAVLKALAARVERIELAGEPVRALNNITRGFRHLPVRVG